MTVPHFDSFAASRLIVAVDGGNTKTDAIAITPEGDVFGWGQSGNSDIYARTEEQAASEVLKAIMLALDVHQVDWELISHITLRLAGIDWLEDAEFWSDTLSNWGYRGSRSTENDGFAGIRLGSASGVGMAITAGTYSAIAARGHDGREFGLNMWSQHYMGGYGLGESAYRAVILAELGMAPATSLSQSLPKYFKKDSVVDLLHLFSSRDGYRSNRVLADAASLVVAAAKDRDDVALEIIAEQVELFSRYSKLVASRVGLNSKNPATIVIGGAAGRAPESPFARSLESRISMDFPDFEIVMANLPAVAGAGLDALAESGLQVTEDLARRLTDELSNSSPAT
ncbi:MAG: hypothetical protein KF742_02980 [Cryobacterium sp.]|nr:hypothetical protein [Cryobacterium sp.]